MLTRHQRGSMKWRHATLFIVALSYMVVLANSIGWGRSPPRAARSFDKENDKF